MSRITLLTAVTVAAIALAGCAAASPAADKPATAPAVSAKASPLASTQPAAVASISRETTLRTTISPVDAAERILEVFHELRFTVTSYQPNGPPGASGDYFVQRAESVSANQEAVAAECDWVAEGVTDVHFRSSLPDPQYKFVLKKMTAAIQPQTSQSNGNPLFTAPAQ
jgi:hypothetical protein